MIDLSFIIDQPSKIISTPKLAKASTAKLAKVSTPFSVSQKILDLTIQVTGPIVLYILEKLFQVVRHLSSPSRMLQELAPLLFSVFELLY